MDLSRLRNFGIAAHIDAGKTTVSERMLFHTGIERHAGAVDDGTAVLDWMLEERERGITISAAATRFPWREHALNLIDTPGHVDFTVEVERCMRVLDGAVLVLDGVVGVQAQSETVWRQMSRHGVPAIAFVNKCDRTGADFHGAVESLRTRLGVNPVPIQFPVLDPAGGIRCLIDLVESRAWSFPSRPGGCALVEVAVPEEAMDELGVLRSDMIDALAEVDDVILSRVVEDEAPTIPELRQALRRAVLESCMMPVLCGAALRDVGVRPLLDAVVDYLPSPLDVPAVEGVHPVEGHKVQRAADPEGPACALAFKLHSNHHGDLTFVRIYSGRIAAGGVLYNARTGQSERVEEVLRIHAEATESIDVAWAGDIVGLRGLVSTGTGDTLCSEDYLVALEPLEFPDPVISRVIELEHDADRDRLRTVLSWLLHEDPSLQAREDISGQWTLSGMGELHLEVIEHRLRTEFKLDIHAGKPRAAYRETLIRGGEARAEVDRALGGLTAHGVARVRVSPRDPAGPPRVSFAPGVLAAHDSPAGHRAALLQECQVGPRFGYPIWAAELEVLELSGGDSEESGVVESQALVAALRQALNPKSVRLEEPQMSLEIHTPAEYASGIIADLNSRKAQIQEVQAEGATRAIRGMVALYGVFGYSTDLRSLSQGRASFSLAPSGYRTVPESELVERGLL